MSPRRPSPRRRRHPRPTLPFSQSVGRTLKRRRQELGLTLEDVVDETRIQSSQLKAIEGGHYQDLPHSVHSLGFVRRYAKLLGLDGQTATDKYLLERGPLPRASASLRRQRLAKSIVGSRLLTWLVIGAVLITIVIYLIWQFSILAAPPRLNVTQPEDNQIINGTSLGVTGTTTPGAEIKVNGQIIYVDDGGNFTTTIELGEGINIVTVEASNSRRKYSTVERSVLVRLHPPP